VSARLRSRPDRFAQPRKVTARDTRAKQPRQGAQSIKEESSRKNTLSRIVAINTRLLSHRPVDETLQPPPGPLPHHFNRGSAAPPPAKKSTAGQGDEAFSAPSWPGRGREGSRLRPCIAPSETSVTKCFERGTWPGTWVSAVQCTSPCWGVVVPGGRTNKVLLTISYRDRDDLGIFCWPLVLQHHHCCFFKRWPFWGKR